MNLYKIWQDVNNNFDTWESAVVAASTEEKARRTHPDIDHVRQNQPYGWCMVKDVKVELIGVAVAGIKKGVICASYNAG